MWIKLELQPCVPRNVSRQVLSYRQISSGSAMGAGVRSGAPVGRSHPGASDLPSPGTAGPEALGSVGNALHSGSHSWWLQLMFQSLSLIWWQSWILCRLVLTPGKDGYLSYQHGFCSAVSPGRVFLPTFSEEHLLLKHHPSSCYREWIVAGREPASGCSARQGDDLCSHLRSPPKRGRATLPSILHSSLSLLVVCKSSKGKCFFFRSRLDTICLVNTVWWLVSVRNFWALGVFLKLLLRSRTWKQNWCGKATWRNSSSEPDSSYLVCST